MKILHGLNAVHGVKRENTRTSGHIQIGSRRRECEYIINLYYQDGADRRWNVE